MENKEKCKACKGSGIISYDTNSDIDPVYEDDCILCNGTGFTTPAPPVIEPPKIEYMTEGRVIPEILTPAQPPQKQERKTAEEIKALASQWALDNADETLATNSALSRGFIAGYETCAASLQSRVRQLEMALETIQDHPRTNDYADCYYEIKRIATAALSTLTEKP